jgi:hypothetical protein
VRTAYHGSRSKHVTSVYFACKSLDAAYFYIGNDNILRVAAHSVTQIKNGINSYGVGLLPPTLSFTPWSFILETKKVEAVALLKKLYLDNLALDDADKIPSLAFNLAHIFPDLPLRPLRENTGLAGSGKTEAAMIYAAIIYGHPHTSTFKSVEELWIVTDKNPVVTADNLEDKAASRFFDIFTVGVTGGSGTKRRLYTSEQLLSYKMNSLVTITCIRGGQDEEIIQRTVTFQFDKAYHLSRHNYQLILQEILKNRQALLSGIFQILADDVMPYRDDYNSFADVFLNTINHPRKRLDLFFREMIFWIAAICKYTGDDWEKITRAFFDKITRQYNTDVVDSSPILQLLNELKARIISSTSLLDNDLRQLRTKHSFADLKLTIEGISSDYFNDFDLIHKRGRPDIGTTAKSLGQRLRGIENSTIKASGWSVEKINSSKGIRYRFIYDLKDEASVGGTPNISNRIIEAKKNLQASEKKTIVLDKPIKTPSEMLTLIGKGDVSAVEVSSIGLLGSTQQDTIDILELLERSGIPVVINKQQNSNK